MNSPRGQICNAFGGFNWKVGAPSLSVPGGMHNSLYAGISKLARHIVAPSGRPARTVIEVGLREVDLLL